MKNIQLDPFYTIARFKKNTHQLHKFENKPTTHSNPSSHHWLYSLLLVWLFRGT